MNVLFLQQQKTVCDFVIRPRPLRVEHNVLMPVCLSVCLSVSPVPDPKSKTAEIGRKQTHDTGDRFLEVERSNTCREWENFGATQLACFTAEHVSEA